MDRTPIKIKFTAYFLMIFGSMLYAQDKGMATIPPTDAIQSYLSATKEYATLFSGKIETPYSRPFVNHPYLETNQHIQGVLCYNGVVYQDVFMLLDLFRDELTVFFPGKPYRIVLENEKFNYAVLHGFTIIASNNIPNIKSNYAVLISDGPYPVVKQYRGSVREVVEPPKINRYAHFQIQYFVCVNGVAYPVKNRNALLKLFPDRRKELNDYAKQNKLNFGSQRFEQSIVALVKHYETIKVTQ